MRILLAIILLTLTACGGHTGKKIEHQPLKDTHLSFDFGNLNNKKIVAYLVTDKDQNSGYSRFYKEYDIYPWFNNNQLNKTPQLVCYGRNIVSPIYKTTNIEKCLSFFKEPHKPMLGTWHLNQIFIIEPWGMMTSFSGSYKYAQLIQYKGNKYQTAVIGLNEFKLLLKDLQNSDQANIMYENALAKLQIIE